MPDDVFDSIDDVFDRLDSEARRLHVSPALLDVQTREGLERARTLVNEAIERDVVSARTLSRRTNVKESAISAFRNRKWKGRHSTECTTASMLAKAIDQIINQQEAEETSVAGYVTTGFASAVLSMTKYATKRNLIAAFVAPAGSGKSTVMRYIEQETPGAVLITVRKARSAPRSFLQIWSRVLGLAEHGRTEDIQDRIVQTLVGSSRLTLVDESHKLQTNALDVLRETWDLTRIPIVMAGTPSFKTTLTTRRIGVQATELMDQLYSRVGIYRDLTYLTNSQTGEPEQLHSREDIRKLFNRAHVRLVRDGEEFLCRLANSPGGGGLRVCVGLVQMVVDLYPREPITAERLRSALVMKLGPAEAKFRVEQAGILGPADQQVVAATG